MKCEYCLEVKNLTVRYGDIVALENVSFSLEKGKFYTIVGPNGGGKSTLVKTIVGIIDDYDGEIKIFGKERDEYLREKLVGYVPQMQPKKEFPIKVIDVVLMGLFRERKFRFEKEHYKKAFESLERVGMESFASRLIHELSGGQRQRVMIARAIVSNPELLIMDEPTVGLDSESQAKFYELVKDFKESGMTVIVVSHDVGFVSEYSDGILCINRKLVVHAADISELPKRFFTKLYGYDVKTVIHDHKE
jgi:zinc transport system ATP-binding protein